MQEKTSGVPTQGESRDQGKKEKIISSRSSKTSIKGEASTMETTTRATEHKETEEKN